MVIGNMDSTITKEAITDYNITSINTIKYGDCPTPGTQAADKGTASINTPDDTGATLTITGVQPQDGVNLDNTDTPCSVKVEGTNKLTIEYKQGGGEKCIEIEIIGINTKKDATAGTTVAYGHIFTEGFDTSKVHPVIISPTLMVIVGMILLVMTIFPPVIVAALRKTAPLLGNWSHYQSPMCKWGADEKDQQDKWTNTGETWTSGDTTGSQDASFWHGFDLLIVLKISLVAAVLWTRAYYKGDSDGYPPSDPNQRECKKLNVTPTSGSGTELTYTIGQNFAENHANNCGFQNMSNAAYYAHFIPPSLMVLIGMGLPLPNLTIVTTVIRFVFIVKFIGIVLGTLEAAVESSINSIDGESKSSACF